MNLLFDGRFKGTPTRFFPWTGCNDSHAYPYPAGMPTFFGPFDIITAADGTKMGRFMIDANNDPTIKKERSQVYKILPATPSGVQWYGFDFWINIGYPTHSIISQFLWQGSSGPAAPPAVALKLRPDLNGLLTVLQSGVSGTGVNGVYEFKSVDGGIQKPPGQLWAIPQGHMNTGVLYQIKKGINWSTKSPNNPRNKGPADGWIKTYYRVAGSNTWIPSVDAGGFATVRVNTDGSIPYGHNASVEIYDLAVGNAGHRELHSHGLIIASTEAEIDLAMAA